MDENFSMKVGYVSLVVATEKEYDELDAYVKMPTFFKLYRKLFRL